jgi:hypothetical protein
LKSPRVSGIVLIDAVGIEVPGHPVADFFCLTMDQVFALSFHNPEPFRIDPATLPPAAQAIAAGNRAAIGVYAGTAMADPTLLERLGSHEGTEARPVRLGDADHRPDDCYRKRNPTVSSTSPPPAATSAPTAFCARARMLPRRASTRIGVNARATRRR